MNSNLICASTVATQTRYALGLLLILETNVGVLGLHSRVFFIFVFFKKNYKNIFLVLDFTVLYPYRPAGGLPPGKWAAGTYM